MRIFSAYIFTKPYFGMWFRVYGYGFSVSNSPPLFSERNGLRKTVRVFGVKFELLMP
jgi:hypothetical protein